MLKKRYKLPVQDFLRKRAIVRRSAAFTIKLFPSSRGYCRVGAVISRAVAPRAVTRNRIRRIFFSLLQEAWSRLSPSYDLLFIVQSPALTMTTETLRKEINESLTKAF